MHIFLMVLALIAGGFLMMWGTSLVAANVMTGPDGERKYMLVGWLLFSLALGVLILV